MCHANRYWLARLAGTLLVIFILRYIQESLRFASFLLRLNMMVSNG